MNHSPRTQIDRMVDFRKNQRPYDQTPIKTKLSSEDLHRALNSPRPQNGRDWPNSVLYRGYRIVSKDGVSVGS